MHLARFAISFLTAGAMIAFGGVQIAFLSAGIGLLGVIVAVSRACARPGPPRLGTGTLARLSSLSLAFWAAAR